MIGKNQNVLVIHNTKRKLNDNLSFYHFVFLLICIFKRKYIFFACLNTPCFFVFFKIKTILNFILGNIKMLLIIFILLSVLFIILGFKNSIINYIKVFQTYKSIPCPRNRLLLLGNLLILPLNPYRKK